MNFFCEKFFIVTCEYNDIRYTFLLKYKKMDIILAIFFIYS